MARRFFNWCLRLAYWLLLRLKLEGEENVPEQGPVIFMINHIHFLDPFVVVASVPRLTTALSKEENMHIPFFGLIFKWYGAIPVRRGEVDRRAIRQTLKVLKAGEALLLAPEGTRSADDALQEAHNGLAYVAHHSHAAIVPVAITGTPDFNHNVKRLRRTPVHIQLGRPFYLQAPTRRLNREMLHGMTTEAMYQLAALLPPEHRGFYSDLDQTTERYILFVDEQEEIDKESDLPALPVADDGRPRFAGQVEARDR